MCMYSYCMFMYLHSASWHSSATLTEVFPFFFLSCKANANEKPAEMGHGPHSSKLLCCSVYCLFCVVLCIVCFVSFCLLFVLCRSVYCLCINVYCTTATGCYPTAVNKYIITYGTIHQSTAYDRTEIKCLLA